MLRKTIFSRLFMEINSSQWEKINELVQKIYLSDIDSVLDLVTEQLSELFFYTHSMYHYYRSDGQKMESLNYHSVDLSKEVLMDYQQHYENIDYIAWYSDIPISRAFRDTDIITDALRANSELMRNWLEPNNIHFGINSTVAYNNTAFAGLSFFRSKKEGDFSENDREILSIINDHLSIRFYQNKKMTSGIPSSDTDTLVQKYRLSNKEMEILNCIRNGALREDLPGMLYISENTLKKHFTHIYTKLGITKFEQLLQMLQQSLQDN